MHSKNLLTLYTYQNQSIMNNKTIDYIIRNTWQQIAKMYNEEASKYGSTMVTGFALLSIDPKTGTPSTQLGPKMGIQSTSLSRTIKKLEEQGLITKVPNAQDKRSVLICLTEEGKVMRNVSKQIVLNFNDQVNDSISKDELETYIKVSEKIKTIAQTL